MNENQLGNFPAPIGDDELREIEMRAQSDSGPCPDLVRRLVAEVRRRGASVQLLGWGDVDLLRKTAEGYEPGDWGFGYEGQAHHCRDLANRIAALLPPPAPSDP